jgi:peptide/nickel transport system permease protein
MFAAWRRGGFVDNVLTPVMMALQSFPAFFLSLLAVYFLGLKLGWFPIQHAYSNDVTVGFNWHFLTDAFRHAQLPILVIIAVSAGGWLLGMRNVMINTVAEDYVAFAHAKGLPDRQVMTRYAARNAILPPLTGFASFFASAVGGLILIEYVFSYPGVGLSIQTAALGHDYPLVQALLLLLSFCVLVANLIMDCVYVVLDPRVRAA